MTFLTPKEVAAELKLSRSATYDLLRSGVVRVCKIGTGKKKPTVRVRREDLDAYIEQSSSGGVAAEPEQRRKKRTLLRRLPLSNVRAAGYKG